LICLCRPPCLDPPSVSFPSANEVLVLILVTHEFPSLYQRCHFCCCGFLFFFCSPLSLPMIPSLVLFHVFHWTPLKMDAGFPCTFFLWFVIFFCVFVCGRGSIICWDAADQWIPFPARTFSVLAWFPGQTLPPAKGRRFFFRLAPLPPPSHSSQFFAHPKAFISPLFLLTAAFVVFFLSPISDPFTQLFAWRT